VSPVRGFRSPESPDARPQTLGVAMGPPRGLQESSQGLAQGLARIFPGTWRNPGHGWLWGPPRFTHSRKTNNLCAL